MNCATFTVLLLSVTWATCSKVNNIPPEPYNTTTATPPVTFTTPSNSTPEITTSITTTSTTKPTKSTTITPTPTTTTDEPTSTTMNVTITPTIAPTQTQGPITTSSPPVTPPLKGRHFDAISFLGGIILTTCLIGLSVAGFKFYKIRSEARYNTL